MVAVNAPHSAFADIVVVARGRSAGGTQTSPPPLICFVQVKRYSAEKLTTADIAEEWRKTGSATIPEPSASGSRKNRNKQKAGENRNTLTTQKAESEEEEEKAALARRTWKHFAAQEITRTLIERVSSLAGCGASEVKVCRVLVLHSTTAEPELPPAWATAKGGMDLFIRCSSEEKETSPLWPLSTVGLDAALGNSLVLSSDRSG